MRKFTLVLSLLAFAGMVSAQVAITGVPEPVKEGPAYGQQIKMDQKGGGDIFWQTSFDWGTGEDTTSWSLPEGWGIVDNSGLGNPWMWRSPYDTLGGCCTWQGPSPNFLTPMDGYIVLPADEYNRRDGVGSADPMDSYFETPNIDCSNVSSVVVKFSQLFRLCCGSNNLKMSVTNDDGVHWAEYDCLFGLPNNRVCDLRYRNVEFNVSDVAAGMPNVKIRFHQWGNSHYYWMIDDLRLEEAYDNELVLEDYFAEVNGGFDERVGHLNYWPMTQMGMESEIEGNIGDYQFIGAMLNNGMADQEDLQLQMTILKNGEQVWQETSDPTVLWPLDRDTLTVNEVFLADDYGDYQMTFEAISNNTEEVPANNSKAIMFTVTDSLYHRADFSPESASNTGGWVGGSNAGDMVGVFYDLYTPTEISSITAYIWGVTDSQIPDFQYVLLKDMGDDGLVEWITSDIYAADSTIARSWQTRNMELDGETEFLEPGSYVACVRFWGDDGTEEGSNGMSIGWDMDNREGGYTYNYQAVSDGWFNTGKMNLIGMVFNETGGPTEAPVTFNVDMNAHIANGEFHPEWDFIDVAGSFNDWTGSEALTDEDGDGIYTITLDAPLAVGSTIEYKYRINANWDTSEFPLGGPNRTYKIRYWNIVDDVYNGGETTGVPTLNLIESFKVYPNPTTADFTVQISNKAASDVTISMMDIQGQVIYTKTIENVLNHSETIHNSFAKGVYFVTVQSGSGKKVEKLIIQ